ncbi:MAG: hypothetical protein KGO96_14010 [Elusimicrobia bacterium]|nr:hypothetical protein [Sphingomonadales bacterium]MDE2427009.1 hypothetical protein [Elusimicrobiota bacterium]
MIQRIKDWRLERRIKRLSRKSIAYMQSGDRAMCKVYWGLMVDAINRRSPAQVRRMERRMGISHA